MLYYILFGVNAGIVFCYFLLGFIAIGTERIHLYDTLRHLAIGVIIMKLSLTLISS